MAERIYPRRHRGTALIVGSAACVFDDIRNAKVPDPVYIGINEGVGVVPCLHLVTQHPEHIQKFLKLHREAHPGHPDPVVHCPAPTETEERLYGEWVDFWWNDARIPATSAAAGIVVTVGMGFSPVVLCGCPLNGGGYYRPVEDVPGDPRIGLREPGDDLLEAYQARFKAVFSRLTYRHVRSMSGFTREVLGGPAWLA